MSVGGGELGGAARTHASPLTIIDLVPPPVTRSLHRPDGSVFDFATDLAGHLVLICCVDAATHGHSLEPEALAAANQLPWDSLRTMALGMFVGETAYRNTLDAATRVEVLQDGLSSADDTVLDCNLLFLPVVCITPLTGAAGCRVPQQRARAVTYSDFLAAACPLGLSPPLPPVRSRQLYQLCADARLALRSSIPLGACFSSTTEWVHAKALQQMAWYYERAELASDSRLLPRHDFVRAVLDFLLSDQPPAYEVAVTKFAKALDAMELARTSPRYRTPADAARLAELRALAGAC